MTVPDCARSSQLNLTPRDVADYSNSFVHHTILLLHPSLILCPFPDHLCLHDYLSMAPNFSPPANGIWKLDDLLAAWPTLSFRTGSHGKFRHQRHSHPRTTLSLLRLEEASR